MKKQEYIPSYPEIDKAKEMADAVQNDRAEKIMDEKQKIQSDAWAEGRNALRDEIKEEEDKKQRERIGEQANRNREYAMHRIGKEIGSEVNKIKDTLAYLDGEVVFEGLDDSGERERKYTKSQVDHVIERIKIVIDLLEKFKAKFPEEYSNPHTIVATYDSGYTTSSFKTTMGGISHTLRTFVGRIVPKLAGHGFAEEAKNLENTIEYFKS